MHVEKDLNASGQGTEASWKLTAIASRLFEMHVDLDKELDAFEHNMGLVPPVLRAVKAGS